MTVLRTSVFALLFLALALPAVAQTRKPGRSKAGAAERKRAKSYVFSGDDLRGELQRPGDDAITGRVGLHFGSLIRVRTTFLPEVSRSAEEIRR